MNYMSESVSRFAITCLRPLTWQVIFWSLRTGSDFCRRSGRHAKHVSLDIFGLRYELWFIAYKRYSISLLDLWHPIPVNKRFSVFARDDLEHVQIEQDEIEYPNRTKHNKEATRAITAYLLVQLNIIGTTIDKTSWKSFKVEFWADFLTET